MKHIISIMSNSKARDELATIENMLNEYYEDQTKVAEKLREMLYGERGMIDEMEGVN